MNRKLTMEIAALIFILVGTALGAIATMNTNKVSKNLITDNQNLIRENNELTKKVIKISDNIKIISNENKRIIEENKELSEGLDVITREIKEIAGKTEFISEKNLLLVSKINNNTEAVKFFNSYNYSYLKMYFPIGFIVKRQNPDGEDFIKAYGNSIDYEKYDIKIFKNFLGRFRFKMENHRFLDDNDAIMIGGIIEGDIDPKAYKTLQIINPVETIPGFSLALFMINDGYEFTYAVGQTPNIR